MNLIKKAFLGFFAAALCVTMVGCNPWGNDDDKTTPKNPTPVATGYEITVYQDGAVASKADAESYTLDNDAIDFQLKAKDKATPPQTGKAKGTWVVKHRSWKSSTTEQRYEVTLYSGTKAVGTWKVHGFTTDAQSVLLFPADGSEVLRVCGNVVVKTLKGGKAGTASNRVTVYNGDSVVYKLDLRSYLEVGRHVQGDAADGSGTVWIWGNYKLENLVR